MWRKKNYEFLRKCFFREKDLNADKRFIVPLDDDAIRILHPLSVQSGHWSNYTVHLNMTLNFHSLNTLFPWGLLYIVGAKFHFNTALYMKFWESLNWNHLPVDISVMPDGAFLWGLGVRPTFPFNIVPKWWRHKIKFLKLWDLSWYSERTMSKRPTYQKWAFWGNLMISEISFFWHHTMVLYY